MSDDFLDDEVAAVTFETGDDSVAVIVGSGAGGGTLANELTQKGIDVVVIEAGPRFKDTDFENDEWEMYDRLTWKDKRAATGTSPVAQNFAEAPTWLCKGVGGSTLHWAAMCPRFQPHEFKARSTYGDIPGTTIADWPIDFAEIEPYYVRAEDRMGVSGRNGIGFHGGSNNYKVMALGAKRMGYTDFDTNNLAINIEPRHGRNACDQIGFCMQGCRSGAKWSTFNTKPPAGAKFGPSAWRSASSTTKLVASAGFFTSIVTATSMCKKRGLSASRATRSRRRACCSTRNQACTRTGSPTPRAWSARTTCVTCSASFTPSSTSR